VTIRGPLAVVLLVVLALSLALNFAGIGFAAARYMALRQGPSVERLVELGVRSFPPEIRRRILSEAIGERGDLRDALTGLGAARQQLFSALKADPYDQAAVDAAAAAVQEKTVALEKLGHGILSRAVAGVPADVRAKIVMPRAFAAP
jgi:hypothetical protein